MKSTHLIAAIEALGAEIQSNKDTIFFQKIQIDDLKRQIEELKGND